MDRSAPSLIKPKALLSPRRLDIAVKWRFFRHLAKGNDPDSERVYRWHIEKRRESNGKRGIGMDAGKRTLDDYVRDAAALSFSMRAVGYWEHKPIPLDSDGEILGGAHRLACALSLGSDVYVEYLPQKAWAPAWDRQWFQDNGMSDEDLTVLLQDWNSIIAS